MRKWKNAYILYVCRHSYNYHIIKSNFKRLDSLGLLLWPCISIIYFLRDLTYYQYKFGILSKGGHNIHWPIWTGLCIAVILYFCFFLFIKSEDAGHNVFHNIIKRKEGRELQIWESVLDHLVSHRQNFLVGINTEINLEFWKQMLYVFVCFGLLFRLSRYSQILPML